MNPFWTFQRLLEMTELSLCLWGSAYWFVERGQSGTMQPSEIWWGRPDRVRVVPHPTNYLSAFLYDGLNGQALTFQPSEVIWFRFPNPVDEYAGLAPLAAPGRGGLRRAAMTANRALFTNGSSWAERFFPNQE